ncbi:transmembrane protein 104 homolog [Episyrphus balteatus]|uniref:transmembrane protein 104 homolog n=1 Tax=Episyrphus balteatus TaxID=286459 RepID=UPI0024859B09|nr:transmembrane protein 104 homolog [Episyrphus balteatus]
MPYRIRSGDEYPPWMGFIFVFNLIVGTGALTLPAVFNKAGWLLSLTIIVILAGISYMTVTFIIETMSCANAVIQWQRLQYLKRDQTSTASENNDEADTDDPTASLLPRNNTNVLASSGTEGSLEQMPLSSQRSHYYMLDRKVEMGEMAGLFFNDFGRVMFYLCIAIYMYGDMSIYSAAVAKSLRDVVCHLNSTNGSTIDNVTIDTLCWETHTMSRLDVYRLFLVAFIMILGPFALFSVQRTKYIQMFTVIFRWLAFISMIGLAIKSLLADGPQGHPPVANVYGLPSLFGACVYSFMCHHSLPSLIVPISDKKHLKSLLSFDYLLIVSFYILLALTGSFAFAELEDLYTLNFIPSPDNSLPMKIIEYFLALFPVFTLSASFPVIAITLRNNLQTLFLDMSRFDSYNFFLRRVLFPMLAIVPPFAVTYFTESLTSLVGFTGSYAGTGIQYIIPVALVYFARRTCADLLGRGLINEYRSPFRSSAWLIFVIVWSWTCMILVTVNFFTFNAT